jgi:hypothetical protein
LALESVRTVCILSAFGTRNTLIIGADLATGAIAVPVTFHVRDTRPGIITNKACRTVSIELTTDIDAFRIDTSLSRLAIHVPATALRRRTLTLSADKLPRTLVIGSTLVDGLTSLIDAAKALEAIQVIHAAHALAGRCAHLAVFTGHTRCTRSRAERRFSITNLTIRTPALATA